MNVGTPYKGMCLLIPYNDVPHLFVIVNNPCADGQVLAVMITSIKKRKYDSACELDDGDHEFIKHPSYVAYRIALQIRASHIARMIEKKVYVEKEPASEELLKKVCDGLEASEEIKPKLVHYVRACWAQDR